MDVRGFPSHYKHRSADFYLRKLAGKVTSSQLFPFVDADLDAPYALTPSNGKGVCFVNKNGILSNVDCDAANPAANEVRSPSSRVFFALMSLRSSSRLLPEYMRLVGFRYFYVQVGYASPRTRSVIY
jgi:hypothetical protein